MLTSESAAFTRESVNSTDPMIRGLTRKLIDCIRVEFYPLVLRHADAFGCICSGILYLSLLFPPPSQYDGGCIEKNIVCFLSFR